MIGLSGLITPSLDQMVDVATEMERRGVSVPLLIGGATTSRQHTAVKIAPVYAHETVHVLDASRVVDVVSGLLDPERRPALDRENRELQERLREQHAEKLRRPLLPLPEARANRERVEFDDLPEPPFRARAWWSPRSAELVPYIDWQFFFHAWDLKGKFPAILENPAARELHEDALAELDEIVRDGSLRPRGVYGFWPAHAEGDDVVLDGTRFCFLRQQAVNGDGAAEPLPRRLRRPERRRARGVRRRRSTAPTSWPTRHRAALRRLPRHHRQGARRPAGRGVRRVAARARAPRVVRARRGALGRRADRRAVPRHPARVRLSGVPGSQREGEAVRAARGALGRPRADRELRDAPRRRGERDLPRAPARAVLRGRPDRRRPAGRLRGS